MKNWIAAAACLMFAASPLALAQDKSRTDEKKVAQQDRMKACSKEAAAKNLKGDERKKFMSVCLKG